MLFEGMTHGRREATDGDRDLCGVGRSGRGVGFDDMGSMCCHGLVGGTRHQKAIGDPVRCGIGVDGQLGESEVV